VTALCLVSAASDPVDPILGNNSATLVLGLQAAASRTAGKSSGKSFRGTARSDRIVGTARDDVIRGLGGDDVFKGPAGRTSCTAAPVTIC
jgi:hypothetical protein